jgi:hypothetical protein
MTSALPLGAALRQGALVTLANWPIVVFELCIEALYKLALGVPIIGGALMVAVLLDADISTLVGGSVRTTADLIVASLFNAPVALTAFLAAVGVVAYGGSLVMFVVKSGTLAVLVQGERQAGDLHRAPVRQESLRRASAYRLAAVIAGMDHFGRRAAVLAGGLGLAYLLIGGLYIGAITYGFRAAAESTWGAAWPLLVLVATSTCVVGITAVNFLYSLARVVIISDDCGVGAALRRVRAFLVADARQVIGIFAVMSVVSAVGAGVSLTATASLAMIGWVPVVGLLVWPLQLAAWIIRGWLFQYISLTSLAAYQTQYRRFAQPQRPAGPAELKVFPA